MRRNPRRLVKRVSRPGGSRPRRSRQSASVHEPWTEAWVDETYARALVKIRRALADKRAVLSPQSSLYEYVEKLCALSDD
jgi:hypothetical protein